MHFYIYLTLVVAVVVTHFKGIECFNLGRNVPNLVSQQPSPSTKGEDDERLKQDAGQKIFDGPMFRQVVEQNGFSNEILGSQISNFLASTQNPSSKNAEQLATRPDNNDRKSNPMRTLIENLDDISFQVRPAVDGVPVEQVPGGQVSTQPVVAHLTNKHSDERDDDDEEEDSSNEVRSNINLDSTDFHKRPESGMLIQPESEDWFLVRQYMDDESFRGASRELAKEYFWQPVKGAKGLHSEESDEDDSNESS